MACSNYILYYNASGVLSATYKNCGDQTTFQVYLTGGGASLSAQNIIVTTVGNPSVPQLTCYTGSFSAGPQSVPGFVYNIPLAPWSLFTVSTFTSAAQAHGLPYPLN